MFQSFFPKPKWFLITLLIWCSLLVGFWYTVGDDFARWLGFAIPLGEIKPLLGFKYYVTPAFLWFYTFYFTGTLLFYLFWKAVSNHKWLNWSILAASLIMFLTYFSVQFMVSYNNWLKPFYDLTQKILTEKTPIPTMQIYSLVGSVVEIFLIGAITYAINRFIISHFIFRWRTAMSDHYIEHWQTVRTIEGASQRVQEDTMKFATIMEGLGVSLVDAVMTLFAFLPVLMTLSQHVTELPLVGKIPMPLVCAAIAWSVFGTLLLSLIGIKLPGLQYENQKVEAAYRKELVYGEDNSSRAQPEALSSLYDDVRKNYFHLYMHYSYFNITRMSYIYISWILPLILLVPTLAAAQIGFGVFMQIKLAFYNVNSSFQYLVTSWKDVVDLISIKKRLDQFEEAMETRNQ